MSGLMDNIDMLRERWFLLCRLRDFRLTPRSRWDMRSSGILRNV